MVIQPWVVMTRLGFVRVFVNLPRQSKDGEWYGREAHVFDPLTAAALGWSKLLVIDKPRNFITSNTVRYSWCLETLANGDVDVTFNDESVIIFCDRLLIALGLEGRNIPGHRTWFKFGDMLLG